MVWTEEQKALFKKAYDKAICDTEREVYKKLCPEAFDNIPSGTVLLYFIHDVISNMGLTLFHKSLSHLFKVPLHSVSYTTPGRALEIAKQLKIPNLHDWCWWYESYFGKDTLKGD